MIKINGDFKPDMEVARSVNLERDAGSIDIVKDYQITDKTREILDRFVCTIGRKISAWSLTVLMVWEILFYQLFTSFNLNPEYRFS